MMENEVDPTGSAFNVTNVTDKDDVWHRASIPSLPSEKEYKGISADSQELVRLLTLNSHHAVEYGTTQASTQSNQVSFKNYFHS